FAASSAAFAQTRDLGALKGQIRDPQGAAVKSADVKLINKDLGLELSTKTDEQGNYAFAGVPVNGHYSLTIAATGFGPTEQKDIALRAGVEATFNISLNLAGTSASVVVFGTTDSIETDSTQIGTRLDLQKIENTPVLNNRLTSLQLLDSSVRPSTVT